jgi:integrase
MGTITTRRTKSGGVRHTAQIRLKRDGIIVHTEAQTFSTAALAKEWLRRREAELEGQRARGETVGVRMTIGDMVAWYEGRERPEEPWGRTKKADLARLKLGALALKRADRMSASDFIDYIDGRRDAGAGPATAGNDIIWLRQVFKSIAAKLRVPVPLQALEEAAEFLRQERTIAKPKTRERRLKAAHGDYPGEEAIILAFFDDRRGPIPMGDIIRFALATARREEEITRLLWADLEPAKRTALLRDVKHPRKKIGNHKHFRLPDEAWAIIERTPVTMIHHADGTATEDPRIFPHNPRSIGAAFTRGMKVLGIEDLHFHDLRHEATSRLFEMGYAIHEVVQFTLHESWSTLKRYTHLDPRAPMRASAAATSAG